MNRTFKYTPGPWKWALYSDGWALVSESALLGTVRQPVNIVHDTPDGKLAETAPDLLAALEKAKKIIKTWHGDVAWEIYDKHAPEMKIINAAIAKARGEE